MALFYTGRAKELTFNGKTYAAPDVYDKSIHAGSFDNAIPGMDERTATALIEHSDLHSFRSGNVDLEEKLTTPKDGGK